MSYKKKSLGQHFLINDGVCQSIVDGLIVDETIKKKVIEIGPGGGALTKHLIKKNIDLWLVELDDRFAPKLPMQFPTLSKKVIHQDILKIDWYENFGEEYSIFGNFPYNISNLILFKIFENHLNVTQMVGMFQKEVAQRVSSPPGNKTYGKISVLLQTYYIVEYLFDVDAKEFMPPPKITSGVVRLTRKDKLPVIADLKKYTTLVKLGFGQRRKKLSNSLKSYSFNKTSRIEMLMDKRPEQCNFEDFIYLYEQISTD